MSMAARNPDELNTNTREGMSVATKLGLFAVRYATDAKIKSKSVGMPKRERLTKAQKKALKKLRRAADANGCT